MNKIHIIFILILFIASCRTTYDRELTIRNNIEKFKSDSIKKINERDRYIDSIFSYVSNKKNINLFTHFINSFPNSQNRINAEKERRKLFFDVKKVIESNLDIDSLIEVNALKHLLVHHVVHLDPSLQNGLPWVAEIIRTYSADQA